MNKVELGVFMPVGNNGWILSKNSPQYFPTFELNKEVAQLAESIGFDRIFSMAKWKNFGGEVEFWKYSLESLIVMAALGTATKHIKLITSVLPSLIHPTVFAKMLATADDVCSGRMGINIVHEDLTHLALQSDNYESYRYEYTEEWLEVVRKLWTEEKVNHHGKHFSLTDCESFPKPKQPDPSVVLATSSEWGYDFVGRSCSEAFIGGHSIEALNTSSLKIKEIGMQRYGRKIKTSNFCNVILAPTDEEANDMLHHYMDGVDIDTIDSITKGYYHYRNRFPNGVSIKELQRKFDAGDISSLFHSGYPIVGGPETVANVIENLVVNGQFDGLLLTFPDFVKGLKDFGKMVSPLLREKNLLTAWGMDQTAS